MKCPNEYEKAWWNEGKEVIVGIDEAGRGPICGPCVVCAVAFPKDYEHPEIYDSKKLSEKKRKELFHVILKDALEYHIEIVSPKRIDEENIYRATQLANYRLVDKFKHVDGVLTDAMPLPDCPYDVIPLVKGDQKSVSIAAASILAKVIRDHIMAGYDVLYPQYLLTKHKGYPTAQHLALIEQYGVQDFYRFSYGPVKKQAQLKLF